MEFKTARHPSLLVNLGYTCVFGLVLVAVATQTNAQSANVEIIQPADHVEIADDAVPSAIDGITRIYFAFGDETFESDSKAVLQRIVKQAKANPESTIHIRAYTDDRGWSLGNLELSRIRARSVAKELIASGIDVARMKAFAFGESQPVATNTTVRGRRLNRRVEVSLIP